MGGFALKRRNKTRSPSPSRSRSPSPGPRRPRPRKKRRVAVRPEELEEYEREHESKWPDSVATLKIPKLDTSLRAQEPNWPVSVAPLTIPMRDTSLHELKTTSKPRLPYSPRNSPIVHNATESAKTLPFVFTTAEHEPERRRLDVESQRDQKQATENEEKECAAIAGRIAEQLPMTDWEYDGYLYHGTKRTTIFAEQDTNQKTFFTVSLPLARHFALAACSTLNREIGNCAVVHRFKIKGRIRQLIDLDTPADTPDKLEPIRRLGAIVPPQRSNMPINQDTVPLCTHRCLTGWKWLYVEKQIVLCAKAIKDYLVWDGVSCFCYLSAKNTNEWTPFLHPSDPMFELRDLKGIATRSP